MEESSLRILRVSFVCEPIMHNLLLRMYTISEIMVVLQSAVVGVIDLIFVVAHTMQF